MKTPQTPTASATEALVDYVRKNDHVSMVEATRIIGQHVDAKGDLVLCHSDYENIVLWANLSQDAIDVISGGLREGLVHWKASSLLVYLTDGGGLTLPVAKSLRVYKKPRWLPVVLRPGPAPAPKRG